MRFVDTHCHLDFGEFDEDREQVLVRSRELGIEKFVVPGVGKASWGRVKQLADSGKDIFYGLGLHPWFLEEHSEQDLQLLENALHSDSSAVAVGETGLDKTIENMPLQRRFFEAHLRLADQLALPVIVHSHRTHNEVLGAVRHVNYRGRGVIHGFAGSLEEAQQLLKAGFMLGIGGVITYPRAKKTRAAVSQLPLSSLLLETDAPAMPPAGCQGQRNSPENIGRVFDALCEIRSEPAEIIAETVWKNSNGLFRL